MIISHKNKYVFVQTPRTASTAIGKELRLNYEGEDILWKHARYSDFLKIATSDEKNYFAFTGIRNPSDSLVSLYFKLKTNHEGSYEGENGPEKWVSKQKIEQYNFIKKINADFPAFFNKFYADKIYNKQRLTKDFDSTDYIYRFENLQEDFSTILNKLGLKQKRVLPIINETTEKKKYEAYYTKDIQKRAWLHFEKQMRELEYDFPKGWEKPTFLDRFQFKLVLYITKKKSTKLF